MEVASADSSGGGGGSSSVGGVRVVCALFEDEADNVNNVLVTSVDKRILRVGHQSTVPKTFIFDQVVTNNTTNNTRSTSNKSDGSFKLSLSSKLSNAAKDIMNASNGSNGNVCVVSLAGLDRSQSSSTVFFHSLLDIFTTFQHSTNKTEKGNEATVEEYSITVCEVMGDVFRDVLQTNDQEEHVLQHDTSSTGIPNVWLTNMISVRIENAHDLNRVLNIIHSRRSRLNTETGNVEYINDGSGSTTNEMKRKERITNLPIHPSSHIVITIEATSNSNATKHATNHATDDATDDAMGESTATRTFTVVSLASGLLPSKVVLDTSDVASSIRMTEQNAALLQKSISTCQTTLSSFQHVLLSVAGSENFHTFRHSKLTYLLQTSFLTSNNIILFIGIANDLIQEDRTLSLLKIGKKICKSASKARVKKLLTQNNGNNAFASMANDDSRAWR